MTTTAKVAAATGGLLVLVVLVAGAAGAGLTSILGPGSANASTPSATAAGDIPAAYQALYVQAAATCPGLPWPVLAAIGKVEADHGRSPSLTSSAGRAGYTWRPPPTSLPLGHGTRVETPARWFSGRHGGPARGGDLAHATQPEPTAPISNTIRLVEPPEDRSSVPGSFSRPSYAVGSRGEVGSSAGVGTSDSETDT